mmetsp:Transcript_109727/g.354265  ORF Transcript_109727/g.354265 Transcript_109727/m.354265 type:complete len:616 (+) Transcript_109727:60-1907(+)
MDFPDEWQGTEEAAGDGEDAAGESTTTLEEQAAAAAAAIFGGMSGAEATAEEAAAEWEGEVAAGVEEAAADTIGHAVADMVVDEDEEDEELAAMESAALARMMGMVPVSSVQATAPLAAAGKVSTAASTGSGAKGQMTGKDKAAGKGQGTKGQNLVTSAATAGAVSAKLIALNRAGHWAKGCGIDVRAASTLTGLDPQRALDILGQLEAKAATVRNPSAFIQVAARQPSALLGIDKPAFQVQGAKRPAPSDAGAGGPDAKRVARGVGVADGGSGGGGTVKISAAVNAKLQLLKKQGKQLAGPAIRELAKATPRDALILLQVLANREQVEDATQWILASLKKKAAAAGASAETTGSARVGVDNAPAVRKQIEYYFSDSNYPRDKFLQSKADGSGWVRISDLLPFNRLKQLRVQTVEQAAQAIQGSSSLVLSSDMQRVRRRVPLSKSFSPGKAAPAVAVQAKAPIAKVSAGAGAPAKAPIAKVPGAKAPVVHASAVTKSPAASKPPAVAKALAAKPPVTKASVGVKAPGAGKPPQQRNGLEFEQMALQAKLLAMNKQGIWPSPHALDEATLAALLNMDEPHRGIEILEEAEDQGTNIKDPSQFVQKLIAEEMTARAG